MDAVFTVGIIGTAFGFFATYLLLLRVVKSPEALNYLSLAMIFCLSWVLLVITLIESGLIVEFPHLFRTGVPVGLCLGPISFLYVKVFLNPHKKLDYKKDALHFLPALLVLLDIMPFLLISAEEKRLIIEPYLENTHLALIWNEGFFVSTKLTWIVGLHIFLYAFISAFKIYKHTKLARTGHGKILKHEEIKWMFSLVICDCLLGLTYLWSVYSKYDNSLAFNSFSMVAGITFLVFNFMLYQKPEILYGKRAYVRVEEEEPEKQYIPFEQAQLDDYAQQVKEFMSSYKPFLNNGYSLDNLAHDTAIGRHHLSIVINKGLGMKYNDMINRYRIEHLIQHYRTVNDKNLTIEGIASEVGFNSRTTFLHSVKKFTGLTPTEFIKRLDNNKHFDISSDNNNIHQA